MLTFGLIIRKRGNIENGPWVFADDGVRASERMHVLVRACEWFCCSMIRELLHHRKKEAIRAIAVWCVDSQSCDRVVQREGEESGVTGRLWWMPLLKQLRNC
jgi:hypothetical protein